jgi:hypothetical protein
MNPTGGPGNGTTKSPSPSDVMSKSSQSHARLTDSGSHRATSGPTLQGRSSYATMARNALLDGRLDGEAGASPAVPLGQPSRRREPHPTVDQTIAIPRETSRDLRAVTERRDASQFDIELDARSRARPVSPHIGVVTSARIPYRLPSITASL